MPPLARVLITLGVLLVVAGLLVVAAGKLGLGKLPGDLVFRRGNATFYIPLMTSVLLSLALSFLLWVFRR